ncbi:MAG: PAS domain S-box protein [Candidatus Omnitrophica bacterium]|nr:PAS domain S-box protein [Candidatus Omnitrophota bacterium]
MSKIKDVMTGEVAVGRAGDLLKSSAIGSCVIVSAYSLQKKVGGLAHVMLPWYSPHEETPQKTRYAGNAIDELLRQMEVLGADINDLEVCLVGAGNVLKRSDDTTAKNNLDSVTELLRKKKIKIKAESVGGTTRRSVLFDIDKGNVFYTEGDEEERLLWSAGEKGLREWVRELEESRAVVKRTERKLRESEERLRGVIEAQTEIIGRFKPDGTVVYVNDIFCQFFGKSYNDLIGHKWFPHAHPDDLEIIREKLEALSPHNPIVEIENRVYSAKEELHWMQFVNRAIYDEQGKLSEIQSVGRDITERKILQEKYDRIFNLSFDLISIAGMDGYLKLINPSWERVLGYTSEELLAKPFLSFVHPEDQQKTIAEMAHLRAGHKTINFENRYLHKDGTIRHLLWTATPFVDDKMLYCITRDITDIKKAEELAQESQKRYAALFASSISGICLHEIVTDESGRVVDYRILDANLSFEEITGISRDKAVGSLASKLYGANEPPFLEQYAKVAETGESIRFETYFPPMNKHFLISAFSISRRQFATVFMDITESKKADEALQEKNRLNQILLDSFPGTALLLRPFTREIVASNKAGVDVGAIPGKCCFSTWGQQDKPCPWCMAPALWSTGKAQHLEVEAGGVVWDAHWIPISDNLYMHFAFDITIRRRAEEKIRESELLYRSLFENMLNGFAYCEMLFDEQGRPQDFIYLSVNNAFESLTGLKDVVGKKVSEVVPDIQKMDPQLFDIYGRVALTGKAERFERYVESLKQWFSVSVYSPEKNYFVSLFDVITERKNAEQALRDSEDRFSTIFRVNPIGTGLSRVSDNKFVDVNDSFLKIVGYTREEIIGHSSSELGIWLYPEERARMISELKSCGQVEQYEAKIRRKTGEIREQLVSMEIVNINGQDHLLGMIMDITERKNIENALRDAQDRLSFSLQASHVGSWDLDLIDHTAFRSIEHDRIFGYTELLPSWTYEKFMEHVLLEDRKMVDNKFRLAIENKTEWDFECRIQRVDGVVRWIWATGQPKLDSSGTIRRIAGIVVDITERKNMEESLRLSEQELKCYIDLAGDAIYVVDLKSGRIINCNQQACYDLGYSKEELLQLSAKDIEIHLKPDDIEEVHRQVVEEKKALIVGVHKRKDGSVFPVEIRFSALGPEHPQHVIAIARDITERRKVEEELRARMNDLKVFRDASVGREERILELKKEIEKLKKEKGK